MTCTSQQSLGSSTHTISLIFFPYPWGLEESHVRKGWEEQITHPSCRPGSLDAFDLGIYKKIGRKQAASAQGLVENAWRLKALVPLSSGEILPGQLKEALLIYNASHNTSCYKARIWAGSTATHFTTMLNHWRRLRTNENKKRQATMKTSRQVASQLEELLILEPGLQQSQPSNHSHQCL